MEQMEQLVRMARMARMARMTPKTPHEVAAEGVRNILRAELGDTFGYKINVFVSKEYDTDRVVYILNVHTDPNPGPAIYSEKSEDYRDLLTDDCLSRLMVLMK